MQPLNVAELRLAALAGVLTRRQVLGHGLRLGLTAPVIAALLAACGDDDDDDPTATSAPAATATSATTEPTATSPAAAATPSAAPQASATTPPAAATATTAPPLTPTTASTGPGRGVGDLLRVLYWQAPTNLNPHLSQGDKDVSPARIALEPLLDYNPAGDLTPILAAEVPSIENGGVAPDGLSVTYTLKEGIVWSDGTPLSAEDVRFTWEYITNPATSSTNLATYEVVTAVTVVDAHTVTLTFAQPNPAWFGPFVGGYSGHVLPKHLLEEFSGENAGNAPFNLAPVGTGAYKVVDFVPGDVISFELNENFRDPQRPYFKQLEFKGGGDATSAARAALQSGETDFAWNLQVEKAVLDDLAQNDAGRLDILPWISVEQIMLNFADPNAEVNGARSEPSTTHPFFSDLRVRQAFALSCDRETIAAELYGAAGQATANWLVQPERFASPNTSVVFDLAAAAALLDEAGWTLDGNVRARDGAEMRVLYQTSTNPVRQKTQEVIKQAWEGLGISTELKSVDAGVYFASDPGNPDTFGHFYADVEMHATGPGSTYPIDFMARFKSVDPAADLAQQSNGWSGVNLSRWVNEEYNALYTAAQTELDPEAQPALFIGMNDLAANEVVTIPLIHRALVAGINVKLQGINRSPWTPDTWDIENWYFDE